MTRKAYSFDIQNRASLVTRIYCFRSMIGFYNHDSNYPYIKAGQYLVKVNKVTGIAGPNTRVMFEYPHRTPFKPVMFTNGDSGKKIATAISPLGSATTDSAGNVIQEWYVPTAEWGSYIPNTHLIATYIPITPMIAFKFIKPFLDKQPKYKLPLIKTGGQDLLIK